MMTEEFEFPQMSITNLTPNVTLATSGRDDESNIHSIGTDFTLVGID